MPLTQRLPLPCAARARAGRFRHATNRPFPTMRAPAAHLVDSSAVLRLGSRVALLCALVARRDLVEQVDAVGELLAHHGVTLVE